MVFIRRVRTKSGATAVQVAEYWRGRQRIIKHIGSAHTEAELGVLLAQARGWIDDGQQTLDIDIGFAEMPTQSLVEENGGQAVLLDPEPPVAGRAPAGRVAATPAGILRDV
ncbi:IS1634 family transposase, partial [Brevibacterium luteolum]|nr:IS1634 family transposase [Brevibacterium luteolum]